MQSGPDNDNSGRASLFRRSKKEEDPASSHSNLYEVKGPLLAASENSFFQQACEVMSDQYVICPRVSVAEILKINARDNKEKQSAYVNILGKQVDLVVCEAESMTILYVVEFDNSDHSRPGKDESLERAFKMAGLPFLHIDCKHPYSHQELIEILFEPLRPQQERPVRRQLPSTPPFYEPGEKTPPPLPASKKPEISLTCPKCGAPMKKRNVTQGPHKGEVYSVCTNYPECQTFYPTGEKLSR